MKKKVLSMLVVFAMVFSMLPATALAVEGEVETINLNEGLCTIEGTGKYAVSKYTGANTLTVKADATITLAGVNITAAADTSAISIESGNVTLIVAEDSTLTGGKGGAGIYVAEGASVTIRSKSNAELTAIGNAGVDDNSGAAGIGGTYANGNSGAITIDGATVLAKGHGRHGAGIGSGNNGEVKGEIKIINSADVTAYGGYCNFEGEGPQKEGASTDDMWAKKDYEGGAAIGGGSGTGSTIANITITGSAVVAFGGPKSAGIGAGYWSNCDNITITNSEIEAYGGSSSAGIGTSRVNKASDKVYGSGNEGTIVISDSTVEAVGGDFGAGIGTGYNADSCTENMAKISVKIESGEVNATGGMAAAGIGGGYKNGSAKVEITGGEVTAEAGAPLSEELIYSGQEEYTTWYDRTACAIGSGAHGDHGVNPFETEKATVTVSSAAEVSVTAYEDGKPAIEGVANDTLEDAYTEIKAPRTGTITPAYTRNDGFWGEGTSNAAVSYVVELYEGDTKIASASLNDVGNIIDGTEKRVTWSIPLAGSTDEYWTVVWADGYPTVTMRPNAVKLIVDGTLVDTNDVQFNAPDDLYKIVASTADSSGALTGYYTTLADALTYAKDGDKIELLWTEGDAPISMAGSVVGNKTVTITGTATVDWTKGDLFIGRGGEGNGKVIFDGANITSSVKKNPASTGIHVSGGKKTDSSVNYGTLEIKNSTIELDYLINRNETVIDGNSTLTVYGGCYTHGRDESESISGTDETATLTIGTGSTVNVINENGMGVGGEGKGEMTVNGTYNANVLNVSSKGTVNIGGAVKIDGNVKNDGSIELTETGATLTSQQVQNVTSGIADYKVVYANGVHKLVAEYVAKIGSVGYSTFEEALIAVADGETITLLDAEGNENIVIDFDRPISFTITGKAPNYALPVVTFQNAIVNIKDAEILIPELDARQNATINVIDSKVYDAGGNSIVKSYYNGAINISGTSEVYTMQVTTMGYITISDTAKLHATWQTNVYGNGLITVEDTAVFNTAALQLTGKDYSGRDNTNADRVGKPATIVVDGATFNVGKVLSSNGADYSYNSSYGVNIGTESGKKAELNVVNGGKVNIYMANSETVTIGADGSVNNGGTITVSCRADGGTVALVNNGSVVLTQVEASLTANGVLNVTSGVEGYEAVETFGTWTVQPKTYTITFDSNGGSAVDSVTYAFGATIDDLPVPTRSGYQFEGWGTVPATMPAENLTLTAQWSRISSGGGGGSYTPSYTITVDDAKNGDITVSPKSASSGTTVTITVDPDKGYVLETLTVLDKNGKEIELTKKADNKYTFKMPSGKVTVEATFMEDNTMLNYFVDVFANDYYYDAVLWAVENGITNGTSATTFSPSNPCTRAQMATFLWRAAGSPEPVGSTNPFVDVSADAYYAKAVQWAYEQGITGGTSATTFSPDETCTRGQMATFLWRDAGSPAVSGEGAPFVDVSNDAYHATAVDWAYEEGITGGTSATTYSPNDPCTRGQMVTFLYRYLAE